MDGGVGVAVWADKVKFALVRSTSAVIGASTELAVDRKEIIEEFVRRKWHPRTVAVWERAKCRCEYCGKNLSDAAADYYHGAHVDHIVPGTGDSIDNLALACIACNRIKRKKRFGNGDVPLPRSELIRLAAASIAETRARDEKAPRCRHGTISIA
jgi:5-methylcytosine-specific restriction endonuclease McrA